LVFVVGAAGKSEAQATAAAYPAVAPLEQYLIADKAAEMELAKSASAAAISEGADGMAVMQH
jgi:hypothetical protein